MMYNSGCLSVIIAHHFKLQSFHVITCRLELTIADISPRRRLPHMLISLILDVFDTSGSGFINFIITGSLAESLVTFSAHRNVVIVMSTSEWYYRVFFV